MADTVTMVRIVHQRGMPPATVAARLLVDDPRDGCNRLAELLTQIAAGVRGGKVTVRVDSSTGVAASATATMVKASGTAGDKLKITVPGIPTFVLTAVASGEVSANGEYGLGGADNDAVAASLVLAINSSPVRRYVTATAAANVVTITAVQPGTEGNSIAIAKAVTTGAAITLSASALGSGYDHGADATATVTFGSANITANDTIQVGSVVFTWKASGANENEITLSTDETVAAPAFLAAVNAHSKLQGLVTATLTSAAVVTLTYNGGPRAGELIYLARTESNSGSVTCSATSLGTGSTEAYSAASKTYTLGAA